MVAEDVPQPIDVRHLGRERVICCWRVGDVLIDPGPSSALDALLAALGEDRPRALLLTHVHLDHAGASGSLVRRWPDLEVLVHELGAPHLRDPEKLLGSARRLYGEDMDRLWGDVEPVPEANLRVLRGGETVGDTFEVAYTPGHASHHVSYLHAPTRYAFVGDVGGVRIPPTGFVLAPTPPPDIDLERWTASLDTIAAWNPAGLAMTHFGLADDDVPGHIASVRESLLRQNDLAAREDEAGFVAKLRADVAAATDPETAAAYEQAAPPDQLYQGLERYRRKHAEGR